MHRACGASCRRKKDRHCSDTAYAAAVRCSRRAARQTSRAASAFIAAIAKPHIGINRSVSRSLRENDPVALIKKDRQRRRVQASVAARHPRAGRVSRCAGAQLSTTQNSLRRQKVARTRSSNLLPLGRTPPHLMKQWANATSPPTVTDRSCSSNCPSPCVSGCHSSQLCRYAAEPWYFIGASTS